MIDCSNHWSWIACLRVIRFWICYRTLLPPMHRFSHVFVQGLASVHALVHRREFSPRKKFVFLSAVFFLSFFFFFFFFFWKFTYLSTFENGGTCHSKVVYRSFVFKSNSIYCTVLRCIVSCRVRFILKNLLLKFVVRFSSPFFSSAELQTLRWNNEMLFSVSWISSNARKFWGRLDSSNLSLKEIFHCFWRYESFHGRWNLRIKGKNPGQVIVEHCSHVPNVSKIRRYNSGKIAFAKQ